MMKICFDDRYSAVASPCLATDNQSTAVLLAQGRDRLRLGDLGGADAVLTDVLARAPQHAEAHLLRADARYSLGRFADAQKDYAALLQPLPEATQPGPQLFGVLEARAHTGLAHVLLRSTTPGSLKQAEQHLSAARHVHGGGALPGPWFALAQARLAFESGDVDAAQHTVGTLVEQHRNDPRVWLTLAEMCDARGQFIEAAQAAERACGVMAGDAVDLMTHTLQLVRDESPDAQKALVGCLQQLEARSGRLGLSVVLAKLQASNLSPAQTSLLLQAASDISPVNRAIVDDAARCKQALVQTQGQWLSETAEPALMRTADPAALAACAIAALRLRGPQWQQTHDASFDLLLQRCGPLGFWTLITKAEQAVDMPGRVAQLLEAAAAINPDDRMTQMLLLRVQSRLGQIDGPLLERLRQSRPTDTQGMRVFILELEAEVAKHDGDYAAAIAALDALCDIVQQPRFFALRASLKLALGYAPAEVRQDCARALSYDNLHYLALYTRAQQDLITRDFSASEKILQLCRTKYPEQPDPLYVLGEIATSQGMSDLAIVRYKAYLQGSFGVGRLYEDEARLALAQAQLNVRDYGAAMETLVQVDETSAAMHQQAQQLRDLVVKRRGLQERGVQWWASLPEIEALIDAKQYDKALATLHHHGAQNSRNVYSLALRARVHLEMGNFAQAESDAQMAQDIAYWDCLNEPLSARILREAQAKNGSVIRMVSDGLTTITRYFQSWP